MASSFDFVASFRSAEITFFSLHPMYSRLTAALPTIVSSLWRSSPASGSAAESSPGRPSTRTSAQSVLLSFSFSYVGRSAMSGSVQSPSRSAATSCSRASSRSVPEAVTFAIRSAIHAARSGPPSGAGGPFAVSFFTGVSVPASAAASGSFQSRCARCIIWINISTACSPSPCGQYSSRSRTRSPSGATKTCCGEMMSPSIPSPLSASYSAELPFLVSRTHTNSRDTFTTRVSG